MKLYNRILLLVIFPFSIFACSEEEQPPENLLPEDTYIRLLGELHIAHNLGDLEPENQAMIDSVLSEIFSEYDTNEEQYRVSHYYYQEDLESQVKRVEKLQEQLRHEARVVTTAADSIKKAMANQEADAAEDPRQE